MGICTFMVTTVILLATGNNVMGLFPPRSGMWTECGTNCQKSRIISGEYQMKECYNEGLCKHKSARDQVLAAYSHIFTDWGPWLRCDSKCNRKRHRLYKSEYASEYEELTRNITRKKGVLVDYQICKDKECHKGPFPNTPCGKAESSFKPRVVGGEPSSVDKWPWQVSILMRHESRCDDFDPTGTKKVECFGKTNYTHRCGGTLISPNWILTAAHCVTRPNRKWIMRLSVIVGLTDLRNISQNYDRIYDVAEIVAHPKWSWRPESYYNHDLALVKLAKPVSADQGAACIPLASTHLPTGTVCMALGWGVTSVNPSGVGPYYSGVLREVDLKVIGRKVCKSSLRNSGAQLYKNQLCAGHPEGRKDTCDGDSGGPLLCNTSGQWAIHGITSYGPRQCASKGNYGVYTKVRNYAEWISEKTLDFGKDVPRRLRNNKRTKVFSMKQRRSRRLERRLEETFTSS